MGQRARTFCISYYEGSLALLRYAVEDDYIVYFRGDENKGAFDAFRGNRKHLIANVGFNIHTYLTYVVDNYVSLPELVVFCKNSVFPRHVREAQFARLCRRDVFTAIIDPSEWDRLRFPVSCLCSDAGYLEINDSHYSRRAVGRYFGEFDAFFQFVFGEGVVPQYLKFAPGANYVVPRENLLLRSRSFYRNLLTFVSHGRLSLESYFVERALEAIWTAPLEEAAVMSQPLGPESLAELEAKAAMRRRWRLDPRWIRRKLAYRGAGLLARGLI